MKRSEFPPLAFSERMTFLRYSLAACISAILGQGESETLALANAIEDVDKRIRGNRPASQPVTWGDLRLIMAGTLRALLEHMEKT